MRWGVLDEVESQVKEKEKVQPRTSQVYWSSAQRDDGYMADEDEGESDHDAEELLVVREVEYTVVESWVEDLRGIWLARVWVYTFTVLLRFFVSLSLSPLYGVLLLLGLDNTSARFSRNEVSEVTGKFRRGVYPTQCKERKTRRVTSKDKGKGKKVTPPAAAAFSSPTPTPSSSQPSLLTPPSSESSTSSPPSHHRHRHSSSSQYYVPPVVLPPLNELPSTWLNFNFRSPPPTLPAPQKRERYPYETYLNTMISLREVWVGVWEVVSEVWKDLTFVYKAVGWAVEEVVAFLTLSEVPRTEDERRKREREESWRRRCDDASTGSSAYASQMQEDQLGYGGEKTLFGRRGLGAAEGGQYRALGELERLAREGKLEGLGEDKRMVRKSSLAGSSSPAPLKKRVSFSLSTDDVSPFTALALPTVSSSSSSTGSGSGSVTYTEVTTTTTTRRTTAVGIVDTQFFDEPQRLDAASLAEYQIYPSQPLRSPILSPCTPLCPERPPGTGWTNTTDEPGYAAREEIPAFLDTPTSLPRVGSPHPMAGGGNKFATEFLVGGFTEIEEEEDLEEKRKGTGRGKELGIDVQKAKRMEEEGLEEDQLPTPTRDSERGEGGEGALGRGHSGRNSSPWSFPSPSSPMNLQNTSTSTESSLDPTFFDYSIFASGVGVGGGKEHEREVATDDGNDNEECEARQLPQFEEDFSTGLGFGEGTLAFESIGRAMVGHIGEEAEGGLGVVGGERKSEKDLLSASRSSADSDTTTKGDKEGKDRKTNSNGKGKDHQPRPISPTSPPLPLPPQSQQISSPTTTVPNLTTQTESTPPTNVEVETSPSSTYSALSTPNDSPEYSFSSLIPVEGDQPRQKMKSSAPTVRRPATTIGVSQEGDLGEVTEEMLLGGGPVDVIIEEGGVGGTGAGEKEGGKASTAHASKGKHAKKKGKGKKK